MTTPEITKQPCPQCISGTATLRGIGTYEPTGDQYERWGCARCEYGWPVFLTMNGEPAERELQEVQT